MPIVRSYMCNECGHYMNVTLTAEQWDEPAPNCPRCNAWDFKEPMQQDFKPAAIGGSVRSKAEKLTEDILEKDYHVGDIQRDRHEGVAPKVRYKDQNAPINSSTWGVAREALESAIASGRQNRLKHGSGLDVLQQNLKNGTEPDLIELSKRRAMRIY